jgi:hypothetical protein
MGFGWEGGGEGSGYVGGYPVSITPETYQFAPGLGQQAYMNMMYPNGYGQGFGWGQPYHANKGPTRLEQQEIFRLTAGGPNSAYNNAAAMQILSRDHSMGRTNTTPGTSGGQGSGAGLIGQAATQSQQLKETSTSQQAPARGRPASTTQTPLINPETLALLSMLNRPRYIEPVPYAPQQQRSGLSVTNALRPVMSRNFIEGDRGHPSATSAPEEELYGAGPQGYQKDNPMGNDPKETVLNTMLDPSVRGISTQEKSFMEKQKFHDATGYESLGDLLQNVDLRVSTGSKAKNKEKQIDESPYSLYEPIPNAKRSGEEDKVRSRDLHDKEAAVADLIDTLDKTATTIQNNPNETLVPLTQAYQDVAALERSIIESGRKLFASGANFTEFEIQNILKQLGPFYGPSVGKQPSAVLNPEERIERLEKAQDLFLNKVNKHFESSGYKPKRVRVTGPDGSVIEVDAFEASRANRLAKDPQAWAQFLKGLK